MPQFNPFAPNALGMEPMLFQHREFLFDSPQKALAMRVVPGAITPTQIHAFFSTVVGNPGLHLEVVNALAPAVVSTIFVPTVDETFTGFTDLAAGAAGFADINDRFTLSTGIRNTAALASTSSLVCSARGTGSTTGARVLAVRVGGVFALSTSTSNGYSVDVTGDVKISGTTYSGPRRAVGRATRGPTALATATPPVVTAFFDDLATFYLDPSTNLPWTPTNANLLLAAGANSGFGFTIRGQAAATGFACLGTWVEVFTVATENRVGGFVAQTARPYTGWGRYTVGGAAALSANTFYWVVASCPYANPSNYARMPLVKSLASQEVTLATDTGERRQNTEVGLWSPAGVPLTLGTVANPNPNVRDLTTRNLEMAPLFVEYAGPTFITDSQPYCQASPLLLNRNTVATLYGQQITDGVPTSYAGVRLPIIWENPAVRPDQPLIVEVRRGAGAITGTGILVATATINPRDTTHNTTPIIKFDGGAFSNSVQYHVIVKSNATPGKGWSMPRMDSRSDLLGSGTTLANVQAQGVGTATDSYFASGAVDARYDLPIILVAAPVAPTPLVASTISAVSGSRADYDAGAPSIFPPYVEVSWSPTALTTAFVAYRVYRRRRSTPVWPWIKVAEYGVLTGYTATTVEAQHTRWRDYEAGWSILNAVGYEGWDYAVTVVRSNGLESYIGESVDLDNDVSVDPQDSWLVSNAAPWLNCPIRVEVARSLDVDDNAQSYKIAGRDHSVVRVVDRIPESKLRITWTQLGRLSDEVLRAHRTAAISGQQMCLLHVRGNRHFGVLKPPNLDTDTGQRLKATSILTITDTDSSSVGYNLPAEVAFDGVNDAATTPASASAASSLNPGSQSFSFFVCARFQDAANVVFLSKGNLTGADGFGIRRDAAGSIQAWVDGASTSGGAAWVSPAWFDGQPHVALGTYDGATVRLYFDGVLVASTALVAGAVTNAIALAAGANNGGTSNFAAAATRAWGLHVGRAYSGDEALAASRYLLGRYGATIPPGVTAFYDLADDRCWDGISTYVGNLMGDAALNAVMVGSPATRGDSWPLRDFLRW